MSIRSLHAVIRFGLGQRGVEPLPANPEAWLAEQLDAPDAVLAGPMPDMLSGLEAARLEDVENQQAAKGLVPHRIYPIDVRFQGDRRWSMHTLIGSNQPFRERLVAVWANHFTVSACAGGIVLPLAAAYVQEAIRPHVTGRFEDMLQAVMHHPGMLFYLNNTASAGPNSVLGLSKHAGLNENLARECLELHTVGVSSGYSQEDVTSFAKVLTGWSVERDKDPKGFVFHPETHEPGPKTVMGKVFPEGYEGGVAALNWLAHHPATYRRLATKLVQHFVADDPAPNEVAEISSVLEKTDGNLKAAALAVIGLDRAWTPLTKLRTPLDYVPALYRALGSTAESFEDQVASFIATERLGQSLEGALLPNGWSDTAQDWLQGENLLRRADWAFEISDRKDAPAVEALIGIYEPLLSESTLGAIRGAGSRREALALLLASPEFMRR
jgi:uncharacterized protein (DUF1800 family)